ncbi:MAG: SapC family protein [Pseudomonadota bacterium]
MAKQLIFYEKVVPIVLDRHREWSVEQGASYDFAAGANSCPLMVSEFQMAAVDIPIVFGKNETGIAPMAILGIEPKKSVFVGEDGVWGKSYIPAFIRRYPFVFAQAPEQDTFALCIDEQFDGCHEDGKKGEKLFKDDDQPTDYLNTQMEFAKNFEIEQRRTVAFCELMEEHKLLDPTNAQITMPDGQKRALTGFHVISKERLKALPEDVVKDLFERDALELIYYHLASIRNMERLRDLTG